MPQWSVGCLQTQFINCCCWFEKSLVLAQVRARVSDPVQVLPCFRCLVFWSDAVWAHHLLWLHQESHDGQWVTSSPRCFSLTCAAPLWDSNEYSCPPRSVSWRWSAALMARWQSCVWWRCWMKGGGCPSPTAVLTLWEAAPFTYKHLRLNGSSMLPRFPLWQVYELMRKCWDQKPEQRITFTALIKELSNMQSQPQPHKL